MPPRRNEKKENEVNNNTNANRNTEKDRDASKVTLSGLLNAIDGVASQVRSFGKVKPANPNRKEAFFLPPRESISYLRAISG